MLEHREQLVKKAAERKINDPNKIILTAIPSYSTNGPRGTLPPILQELVDKDETRDSIDQGDETSTRITIADVYTNARRDRQNHLDRIPAVFLDD